MKIIICLLSILLSFLPSLLKGQDKTWKALIVSNEQRAEKLFEQKAYVRAAEVYKRIVEKDSMNINAKLQLAECFRLLNKTQESEYWYSTVMTDTLFTVAPQYKLHYAEVLLSNGKLTEAQKWYNQSPSNNDHSRLSTNKQKAIRHFHRFYEDSLQYTVYELPINSSQSDFYPIFYDNGLIFLSSRKENSFIKLTNSMEQQAFYKSYYVPINNAGECGEAIRFPSFNATFHHGPVTFFDNETKIIYSKNIRSNKKSTAVRLGLFLATKSENEKKWSNSTPLPFNNPEYSISHPYYDSVSNTLFFISNRKDGFGGTDIYKVHYNNGEWGNVENLGPEINTEANEMFPFVAGDRHLYFASNGHPGMGGLDIFKVDLNTSTKEIINLGYPINSPKDDFGLIIDKTGTRGYFSSNRKSGHINDDIYEVLFHTVKLEGKVVEKLKSMPASGAAIVLKDKRTGKVESKTAVNDKGYFELYFKPGKKYSLEIIKEGYKFLSSEIFIPSKDEEVMQESYVLEKSNKRFVEGRFLIDSEPASGCKIIVADMLTDSLEIIYSNNDGRIQHEIIADTFSFLLAEKNNKMALYRMDPSTKRRASSITYLTIELNAVLMKEIKGTYKAFEDNNVDSDTLYLRNDLLREITPVPVKDGNFSIIVWEQGKYSLLKKEDEDYILLKTFIPEFESDLDIKETSDESF
ncbi:MAG TPA: hypothetical protein VIK89_04105 [Cytophagaceae bacterium]